MAIVRFGPKIDYQLCSGCGKCYENCQSDVYTWDSKKGKPVIARPDECYYCDTCDLECPEEAINIRLPLHSMLDIGIYPKIKPES